MLARERILRWLEPKVGPNVSPTSLPLRVVWILGLAAGRFNRDYCLTRAAGLSFTTLISLIPLAVLFFSLAGVLGGGERIIDYVKKEVFPLVAPDFQAQLTTWLDEHISATAFRAGPTGVVNVAAVFGLLFAAYGILASAERYLNEIWHSATRRSFVQKMTVFWVILTASPFCIALSMTVGDFLSPEGGLIERLQEQSWIFRTIYRVLVPATIGFLGFSTTLLLLPSTRVHPWSAAVGGLVCAILWEVSRNAFFIYVGRSTQLAGFYPKLVALPLFLVWIYLNWMIVLYGAEVSYVHQHLGALVAHRRRKHQLPRRSLANIGLTLLGRAKVAFGGGSPPPTLDALAAEWNVDPEVAHRVANLLVQRGDLVEDARDAGVFRLGRDPAQISLAAVVESLLREDFPEDFATESDPTTLPSAWRSMITSFADRRLAD